MTSFSKSRRGPSILLMLFFGAIVVACVVASIVFYSRYQDLKNNTNTTKSTNNVEGIVKKIATVLDLPTDEQPSLVEVTDKSKVQDNLFFTKALNGDQVLIYKTTGIAVLYRPSTGKVINYAVYDPTADSTISQ